MFGIVFPAKILVATDGSEEADLAAQSAADLAARTGSELHMAHVGETLGPGYSGYVGYEEGVLASAQEELERQAQQTLEAQVKRIKGAEGTPVQSHLRLGRSDEEIIFLAEQIGADLVVVGSRGLGAMRRALMGGVSDSVVRHAPCPTLVVREEPLVFPTTILLATDGSEEANLAATTAAALAEGTDSELHVVTVGPFVPTIFAVTEEEPARLAREARRTLDEQVGLIEAAGGRVAQAHLRLGGAAEEIVALAEDVGAGLIAMGSRGRGGIRRALMGSVSERVVRHAHCAVMIIRG